jgi:hypothetical protein
MKMCMYIVAGITQVLGIILYYTHNIDMASWHFMILAGIGFHILGNTEK